MDLGQLKKDVQEGGVTSEDLLEIIRRQQETIRRLEAQLHRLEARLARYETPPPPDAPTSPTDYSLGGEEKRRRRRRPRPKRRGRRLKTEKLDQVQHWEDLYPDDAKPAECVLVRQRLVWRLRQGRAVLVGYRLYRQRGQRQAARVPGVLPRSEYGLEFLVLLAFLVYVIRVSLDQACVLLQFFCGLPLKKSQANALIDQLARHWEPEFDALCELIALASVLYLDETGWKLGKQNCSLWVFLSSLHSVLLFGCHKDADTLRRMLPPEVFHGIAVSDDAAVYRKFDRAQKCWAHLLRKAIRLALLYPEKARYQKFLDALLEVFHRAKRYQKDGRLSDAGRDQKVEELHGAIWDVCAPHRDVWENPRTPDEQDFSKLVYELFRLVESDELFTFVRAPEVEATNNQSERTLRGPALEREAGRTSQSDWGAHRRSVVVSVLESLRKNLPEFTLTNVVAEVLGWAKQGIGLFRQHLKDLHQRLSGAGEPVFDSG